MIKDALRERFPVLFKWIKHLYYFFYERVLGKSRNELIFTKIYRRNLWGNQDTRSGDGSTLENTQSLKEELPLLLQSLSSESLLDIPCGDFYWMRNLDLPVKKYFGADIVKELIADNNRRYASAKIVFLTLDITADDLPLVDLIFCRDCLPHLPNESVIAALKQIKKSKSKYLLTSTYINRLRNENILIGLFHPINLELAPFNLPKPLKIINDACFSERVNLPDKSLGLWLAEDIPE
ncbi:MAG TPA: class I SAM-dependent methyltransferase [Ignavibacteriaceae bacterium]|nr:class I SAM-dependent methyltransferase [Ignavibacteriaceae bacterium]